MTDRTDLEKGMTPKDTAKTQDILDAAFGIFAQYGYRKTSMNDLARAAGMSRPALYQYFRNKEDIARSLTRSYFRQAAANMAEALDQEAPPEVLLQAAFRAKMGKIDQMLTLPHGQELMDLTQSVAADEVVQGMAEIADVLAAWLTRQRDAGALRFEAAPQDMATLLLSLLDGLKKPPYDRINANMATLAQIIGRGLRP